MWFWFALWVVVLLVLLSGGSWFGYRRSYYGAGAAFIFATSAFHSVEGAPFRLYCDMLVRAVEQISDHALSILLDGGETRTAWLRLVRLKRCTLTDSRVTTASGETIEPDTVSADRIDYCVPAHGRLILTWE